MKVYVVSRRAHDPELIDHYDVYEGIAATPLDALAIIDPPGVEYPHPTRFEIDPDEHTIIRWVTSPNDDSAIGDETYAIVEEELVPAGAGGDPATVYIVTRVQYDSTCVNDYDVYEGIAASPLEALAVIDPPGVQYPAPTRYEIDTDECAVIKWVELPDSGRGGIRESRTSTYSIFEQKL